MDKPLPTKSFTCIHRNCISRMKMQMRNVITNSVKKRFSMYRSIFFTWRRLRFAVEYRAKVRQKIGSGGMPYAKYH